MARTRRRFGAIRKLPSGRFQARYRAPDGPRVAAPGTFRTQTDADVWLSTVETDLARGTRIDHRGSKVAFETLAEQWMSAADHRLKPKTIASYRSLLDAAILPTWEKVELGRIRPTDVREWSAGLSARGLSASRVRQAVGLFARILTDAVTDGALATNPVTGVRLPPLARNELHYLTAAQVDTLAASMPEPFGTFVYVLAYGGLRFGEAAAIRRGRCEVLRSQLRVSESLSEVNGRLIFGTPKTHQARTVALPAFLRDALAAHLRAVPLNPDALVFTAPQGGPLRYSAFMWRIWSPAVKKAKLDKLGYKVTPHLLRHTCATLLISQGANPRAVADHLGHSQPSVTLDIYAAAFEGDSSALAARLDEVKKAASDG